MTRSLGLYLWSYCPPLRPLSLLLLVSSTCQMTTGAQAQEDPLPIGRFRPEAYAFAAYSGIEDSLRVVIRDARQWATYWERVHAHMIPAPAAPAVDFGREMVVLAALGARSSGGYGIRVDSAFDGSTYVEVVIRRSSPGKRCMVTAAFTQPVDLVRLPVRALPVRFRERAVVEEC
jgi:hypothetical protein